MRLSQFFSIDTARVLVKLAEHDPGLMERVTRREPNAYLAALYFDSEMFRSGSIERKTSHGQQERDKAAQERGEEAAPKSWREPVMAELAKPEYKPYKRGEPFTTKQDLGRRLRNIIKRTGGMMSEKAWHDAYKILLSGDPKARATRALYVTAYEIQEKEPMRRTPA